MKRLSLGLLTAIIVVIVGFASVAVFAPKCVGLDTNSGKIVDVSGEVSSGTTWANANNPYSLTANVTVANGAQLIIEPGVTVNFNGYTMDVYGTLFARGDGIANITFNDAQIIFYNSSSGWNEQTNSGCIIENSVFNQSQIIINYAFPKICGNLIVGIQSGPSSIEISGGSPTISNNIITGNTHSDLYGSYGYSDIEISDANQAIITNNTLEDGMIGIAIDAGISSFSGITTITNNFIANNKDAGIYFGSPLTTITENNTVTQNYRGFRIDAYSNDSTLTNNNIFDNNNSLTLEFTGQTNINATNNWWGTTDTTAISQSIYNSKNSTYTDFVIFNPILEYSNPTAPQH